jgi:hypothetical protein
MVSDAPPTKIRADATVKSSAPSTSRRPPLNSLKRLLDSTRWDKEEEEEGGRGRNNQRDDLGI